MEAISPEVKVGDRPGRVKLNRNDHSTFKNAEVPGPLGYCMVKGDGAGSSAFMDGIREERGLRIINEFEYKTDRLFVSNDSFSMVRGGEHAFKAAAHFLHVDVNLRLYHDVDSNQCSVQLIDCTDPHKQGSFLVVAGSHTWLQPSDPLFKGTKNYLPLPADHPVFKRKDFEALALQVNAGDVIRWKSRTIHATLIPKSDTPRGDFRRLTAFVAMAPIQHALVFHPRCLKKTPEQRAKILASMSEAEKDAYITHVGLQRADAWEKGFTGDHWAAKQAKANRPTHQRLKTFTKLLLPASCTRKMSERSPYLQKLIYGT